MSKFNVILLCTFLLFNIKNTSANVFIKNLSDISSNIGNIGNWQESLDLRRGSGGGRGFGGGRSFGGSRKSSAPQRSTAPKRTQTNTRTAPKTTAKSPSFGGNRISSSQAQQKYGVPTKTQPVTKASATGQNTNYVMHHYGGYSSGLMTGYMMGTTSFLWMMPFHPAFYYSRPYYAENPDGTVAVYPPTFSFGKLFMTLIIIGIIVYFIRNYFRKKRDSVEYSNQGSFV